MFEALLHGAQVYWHLVAGLAAHAKRHEQLADAVARNVVGGHMDSDGPTAVGTKCLTTRRIGFAERAVTSEVTHIDPPRAWGVHGIDGPLRAIVNVTVDPLDDGRRSRLTIEVDLEESARCTTGCASSPSKPASTRRMMPRPTSCSSTRAPWSAACSGT